MSEMDVYDYPSITVDKDGNQNVMLTIWTDINAGERIRVRISPARASALLRDLTHQVTYALEMTADGISRGDCLRCKNIRLIEVEDRGRTTRVHCPDCSPDGSPGFPLRPQIGGGLA